MNPFTKKEEKKEEGNVTKEQLEAIRMAKDFDNEGLPDELSEMLKPKLAKSQQTVLDIVKDANQGIIGLRPIVAEYYRKTGESLDPHTKMTPIIHTLIKKGYLHSIDGKKGIYTIHPGLSIRNEEEDED